MTSEPYRSLSRDIRIFPINPTKISDRNRAMIASADANGKFRETNMISYKVFASNSTFPPPMIIGDVKVAMHRENVRARAATIPGILRGKVIEKNERI